MQLAEYWNLFDENGKPSTDEIRAWSKRPAGENRLMYAIMGGHRRYYRPLADECAWDEADRLHELPERDDDLIEANQEEH